MKIKLIAVGKHMPSWVTQGLSEYRKRLPVTIKFELIEIPLIKRGKNADLAKFMAHEGEQMLKTIDHKDLIIALAINGQSFTTEELSTQMKKWHDENQNIALLVGGPEGLHSSCLQKSHLKWSLSSLTLPHPLVRIILVEQLYRAWTLLVGHPYHR